MGPHCCLTSRQLLVLSGQEHTSPHLTSLFSGSRQKVTTSTNNHILYQGNDRALPTSICLLLTPQLDAHQHLDLSLEDQNIKFVSSFLQSNSFGSLILCWETDTNHYGFMPKIENLNIIPEISWIH